MYEDLRVMIGIAAKRYCQQTLVLFLREYFAKEPLATQFEWCKDPARSKIHISSEYPEALMKVPAIIVGDVTGDVYRRTIGQEMIWEHKVTHDKDGVRLKKPYVDKVTTHGTYALKSTISIISYSDTTKRFVADLAEAALRHIGTEVLKTAGITISNCTTGSGQVKALGNQLLRVATINLDFVTEWHKEATDLITIQSLYVKYVKDILDENNIVNDINKQI